MNYPKAMLSGRPDFPGSGMVGGTGCVRGHVSLKRGVTYKKAAKKFKRVKNKFQLKTREQEVCTENRCSQL